MNKEKRTKPNVLVCAYCVDKNDVSEAQMAYEWITRLAKFANLWVVTAGSRFHSECGLENCENIELITLKPHISFKWWDIFDRFVHPGYIEFYFRARKAAKQILSKYDIDLCHHLTPQSLRYPSPLLEADVPLVMGPFHGGLQAPAVMKELKGKEDWFFFLRKIDNLRVYMDPLLRKNYSKAKLIILSAPYVKERLLAQYHNKCVIIPGIALSPDSIAKTNHINSNNGMRMIYVAKLEPSKGLEILLYAMAKLKDNNITLTVYGKGSLEHYYRQLAKQLNIADNITWKGFVPYAEIINSYATADVFALPSLKEPAGGAVIEAMSAGLPILCVDAGGPAYAVTENCGIKVPLGSKEQMVNDLAMGIAKLKNNPPLRAAMGRNAQERVLMKFSWEAVMREMLSVYNSVMNTNMNRG